MRSQKYVFTINNYSDDTKLMLAQVECVYIVYGEEVAPTTGTPHLQGVVFFKSLKSHKQVCALIPGAWCEEARSVEEAIKYAKKDGKWTERGVEPMNKKRKGDHEIARWENAWKKAKTGEFDDIDADIRLRYKRTLEQIYAENRKVEDRSELKNYWYVGKSGCGKSKLARELWPGAYNKDPMTRWWDGYKGEDCVIIDDFDKYQVAQGGDMKRYSDHYPFMAPVKGGYIKIRPSVIVVTSNYTPEEIWPDDTKTLEPINRRFQVIHMDQPKPFVDYFNKEK